jgi:siderophore synthetase component
LSLEAFLPPCLHNGIAFEAHGQNTLARFDSKTKKLVGFIVRDFGGIKGHQETLKNSCDVELDVIPDSCVVAEDLNEVSYCFKNDRSGKLIKMVQRTGS